MDMPQNGKQPNRNNQPKINNTQNTFIKLGSWLLQQTLENRETLINFFYFLMLLYIGATLIRPVQAAKASSSHDDFPVDEYKEPYCQRDGNGNDYCYERVAKVYPDEEGGLRIEYAYNEGINNLMNPNFIRDPRFEGRRAVYKGNENLGHDPAQLPGFHNGMLGHHGMHQNHPNDDFDPINPNNFFAQFGGNPAAHHNQPGHLNNPNPHQGPPGLRRPK